MEGTGVTFADQPVKVLSGDGNEISANEPQGDEMDYAEEEDIPYDKFKFYLDHLIEFIFPTSLQHPLAAARLFAFGMYGPLDEHQQIRTGRKGCRILADYELDQMCLQFEKEDLLLIYSKKARYF